MQNPFSLCMDMFSAGMQVTELLTSSTQVIAHRSAMLTRAMKGEVPFHHKEFIDMWMEKFFASCESMTAAMKQSGGLRAGTCTLYNLMQIMAPFRKRAVSNARRLNKI